MSRSYVVGTRGSALARWQTDHVSVVLTAHVTDLGRPPPAIEPRVITTQGDVNLADRLAGTLEKGFFTAELEAALHAREIDWAVHSLKDLPTRIAAGLAIVAVLRRASPADLLVVQPSAADRAAPRTALPLRAGARVGTSSLRRDAMLRAFSRAVSSVPLRGNVPTRIEKLRAGAYDAVVLAEAGVARLQLDLSGLEVFRLDPRVWQPAPGQGAVAVQGRADDDEVRALFAGIDDLDTHRDAELERAFLRELEGGCTTPFGCFASAEGIHLGLATGEAGWAALTVPAARGARPRAEDLNTILQELKKRTEPRHGNADHPLWQPR